MKKIIMVLAVIVVLLTGCSKSAVQVVPDFSNIFDEYQNRTEVKISTYAPDYFEEPVSYTEAGSAIAVPSKTKVKLSYTVTNGTVKSAQWYINDSLIGSGNDLEIFSPDLGDKKLTIVMKNNDNKEFSKTLNLSVFKYVNTNLQLILPDSLCTDLEIIGGIKVKPAIVDCEKHTATANSIKLSIYNYTTPILIGYMKKGQPFTAKLSILTPASVNNFIPGTYDVAGNIITIIE
ncbi:MAG: hypothetical protein ACK5NK_09985 [Niabella sp.]